MQKAVIEDATTLIKQFILPHASEFYRKASTSDRLQRLASWILTSGKTRYSALGSYGECERLSRAGDLGLNQRISPLVAGGWLIPNEPGPVPKSWTVNPRVHDHFRDRTADEERRKASLAELMNSPRGQR